MKKRLQDFLKNLGSEAREALKMFPVTMILTFLWTIAMVLEDIRVIVVVDRQLVSFYLGFFMAGSFFIESLQLPTKKKMLLESIPAIVSAVLIHLIGQEYTFYEILPVRKGVIYWGGSHRFIIGYCILTVLASIYIWYKRNKLPWETYCLCVFQQIVRTFAIYLFISLGCAVIMESFAFLILEGRNYGLVRKLEWCVFGLYLLPSLAISFCKAKDDISKFTTRLVKYVLFPLVVGAVFIVYLYFMKVMISVTIPSNQIFRMLVGLFLFGMVVWTLLGHFHDETLFMRVAEKMPYVFLPLLLWQGYALGIRMMHYGLTPNRYIGIMFMIFEFLYFCIYHMRRERIAVMVPIFGVMVMCATWITGINMMDMSVRNQKQILEQYFRNDIEEAPEEVWHNMYGAYIWLSEQPECQQYLNERYDEQDIEYLVSKGNEEYGAFKDTVSIYEDNLIEKISVEGYSYIVPVYAEAVSADNLSGVVLKRGQEEYCAVNLQGLFNDYILYGEGIDNDMLLMRKYLAKNNKYAISDDKIFYIDSISYKYQKDSKKVEQYRIKGYVLE